MEQSEQLSENNQNAAIIQEKVTIISPNKYKNLKYPENDIGPYSIYVESVNSISGNLKQMTIGRLIFKKIPQFTNSILDIKAIGRNRIKITVNDYTIANYLINNDIFIENNLKTFIPTHLLIRKGVIYDVDSDLTEEEIITNLYSEVPILEVKRIHKKIDNERKSTRVCIVTFRRQKLPEKVSIFAVKCRVATYNRMIQCFNCQRYGHVTNQCKSKARCSHCSDEHKYKDCTNKQKNPTCALCQEDHKAMDKTCPKYEEHCKIKMTMEENNLSYMEAKYLINNKSYANAVGFDSGDKSTFPDLPAKQTECLTETSQTGIINNRTISDQKQSGINIATKSTSKNITERESRKDFISNGEIRRNKMNKSNSKVQQQIPRKKSDEEEFPLKKTISNIKYQFREKKGDVLQILKDIVQDIESKINSSTRNNK
ncbi:uncharacterized protein LOC113375767 [Ctenocephalides felis]|uniref:uncharacterized protein LOC113375767 n=1 Tax=Ctenocephalides felis TaxID=7515 RepID=UPI000E6E4A84|nr:uncharacterized protein LOC113375767 [Ctenocephalides felis]